jgi:4-amino-4-deoxychorismate lyase
MSDLSLIETMRFEPGKGIIRLNLHMARLKNSARKLNFVGSDQARDRLAEELEGRGDMLRVRLELFADGRIGIATAPFKPLPETAIWTVRIAERITQNSTDPLTRHKTSQRALYEAARTEFPKEEADEVLITNEKGELCEGTITTIFVDDGSGILKTPALSSGCLAGVLRTEMLCSRRAKVGRLMPAGLAGKTVYVGNSLRGLIRAQLKY